MTMFTELYALATTATLSMVISADDKRGTLTISVMPKPKKDVGEPALTKDLTLTATPAEFDGGFVAALKGYREARAGLIEQAEATKEVLQAAKEAAAKKAADVTTKASKPAAKPSTTPSSADDHDENEAEEAGGESQTTAAQTTVGVNPTCSLREARHGHRSQRIVRRYRYNGVTLPDVAGMSPKEIRDLYSAQYPELVSAEIETGEVVDGVQEITFKRAVGTKG